MKSFVYLWSHLGSNQGPPDYESGALTNWAIGPVYFTDFYWFWSTVNKAEALFGGCNIRTKILGLQTFFAMLSLFF